MPHARISHDSTVHPCCCVCGSWSDVDPATPDPYLVEPCSVTVCRGRPTEPQTFVPMQIRRGPRAKNSKGNSSARRP